MKYKFSTLIVLISVGWIKAFSVDIHAGSEGNVTQFFDTNRLLSNANKHYQLAGLKWDFNECLQIVLLSEKGKIAKIAIEAKCRVLSTSGKESLIIWLWFDSESEIIDEVPPTRLGDMMIPGAPIIDYAKSAPPESSR